MFLGKICLQAVPDKPRRPFQLAFNPHAQPDKRNHVAPGSHRQESGDAKKLLSNDSGSSPMLFHGPDPRGLCLGIFPRPAILPPQEFIRLGVADDHFFFSIPFNAAAQL